MQSDSLSVHVGSGVGILRRLLSATGTNGALLVSVALALSMTVPAEAIPGSTDVETPGATSLVVSSASSPELSERHHAAATQSFQTPATVRAPSLDRESEFTAVSLVQVASEHGIRYSDALFTNDPDAAIQWPFIVGVAMSSGYGPRWGRLHAGIDLVPGEGAPVQAIADGTVRIATESGGAYGVTVYIDHLIDGQVMTSHYSHMQYDSLRVSPGDHVQVGDVVGLVGNTGRSYGAHLHFEIIIDGATIDPLPWLRENAGRHDS